MRAKITILAAIAAANFAHGQYGPVPPQPGMPFSADQIMMQVQILSDGTHIIRPDQTSKLYRDSLGRTRSDVYFAPVSAAQRAQPVLMNITIFDPIEGARYLLNPSKKKAQKFPLPKLSEQPRPPDLAQLLAGIFTDMEVQVGPADAAPIAAPGMDDSNAPPSKNESLGTRTMEGVTAVGRRTTMTYPARTIGNDREIVTTFEAWESPELGMMMVMTKNSDPRTGERTTRIANLSRTEPDPALFVVPPDYTIEEVPIPGSQARPTGSAH
jgi:hypothetical protein